MKHTLIALLATTISVAAHAANPVLEDPADVNRDFPPGLIELTVPSGGTEMVGHMYTANGPGPHPTVVMLHGFPGNEKNLDLAQSLRRAGFNTLYFHYRGAWGSGGDYSVRHVTEDAAAALAYVREKGKAGEMRIDPTRVSLFGHSLGGFNAIYTGAADKGVLCTVAAAPADLAPFVGAASSEAVVSTAAQAPVPGLDGYSFADLVTETKANVDDYSLKGKMAAFEGRALMIVSGGLDTVVPLDIQIPLAEAAQMADAKPFSHVVMDADHSFSWGRIAFMEKVTNWMQKNCQ
ncbi:alpha/beta hydrolase family protein [Kordiimonas gwangyangensis]|uniref:alpha/beta hydrolase family protein n=1 Tax=Kordiimonas gwangyangensis TaxID=288022 RepID=UPI00036D8C1D|nr:alpha/beta fold hydrolase [Kordiimonas gwangyangensis]